MGLDNLSPRSLMNPANPASPLWVGSQSSSSSSSAPVTGDGPIHILWFYMPQWLFGLIVGLIVIVAIVAVLNIAIEDPVEIEERKWKVYGVCKCGHREEAAFGNLWFTQQGVCPQCGESNEGRQSKIMRKVIQDGKATWEIKEE